MLGAFALGVLWYQLPLFALRDVETDGIVGDGVAEALGQPIETNERRDNDIN